MQQCTCLVEGMPVVVPIQISGTDDWWNVVPALLGTLSAVGLAGLLTGLLYWCWKKCLRVPPVTKIISRPASASSVHPLIEDSPPATPHTKNIYRATFGDDMLHRTGPKKFANTYADGGSDWLGKF